MDLFRKKKIGLEKTELERSLNSMDLVLLGLGSMVGTGIFTIVGPTIAKVAGPALMISIVIAAIAVALSALIFSEFSSRIPTQGGPYGYLYVVFGEFPAWIAGCLLIGEFFTAISITASGRGGYIKSLFGLKLPTVFNGPLGSSQHFSIDLIPMLVIAIITALGFLSARAMLRFNNILVILKLTALIVFIVIGVFHLNLDNWNNFAPFGWLDLLSGNGVTAGAALMFMAFLGFETVSASADEARYPKKTMPQGILGALFVTATLYILVTVVLTGMINYTKLDVPDVLAFALRSVGLTWVANLISVVVMLTLITVGISMAYALVRIIYSISRDGLLPKRLSKISGKYKVPQNATLLMGIGAMLSSGLFPIGKLSEFLNLSTLIYLMMLSLGIIKLRRDFGTPDKGEFKVPFVPILPALSFLISSVLIIQYHWTTWLTLLILLVIITIIYFLYGYKHSKLSKITK
ncbi:APC family permease [Lactococcus allomyrinae]|uniref:Amino acid permease n=1 Tax=Lactococcus allomyrinae TaxID=2419773 RepID=A0A387BG05_9LACT|nr:amino acid permease [Lactococcus allomyrinae]AYG00349.1 amino acid permease [Lactococcus allomyrinae]